MYAVAPKPGRVVVFRGAMTHQVGTPTKHCELARLTTVFRFKSLAAPLYQEEQAEEEQEEQEETG